MGSLGCVFFTDRPVENYADAKTSDTKKFADYFHYMLDNGVHLAPSQFEAMFLSAAHTRDELCRVLDLVRGYFATN